MDKKITFFGGDNKPNNEAALMLLKTLPIEIEHAGDYPYMQEQFDMPAIHTENGFRYHGLANIKFFVESRKQKV